MLKQKFFFLLVFFASALDSKAQVSSKRKAPKEVVPVIFENVRYTAPTDQMGYVVARDVTTDTVIWKKQVYSIRYNKDLEEDVQNIFIDSLYIKDHNLIIRTERKKVYVLKME